MLQNIYVHTLAASNWARSEEFVNDVVEHCLHVPQETCFFALGQWKSLKETGPM